MASLRFTDSREIVLDRFSDREWSDALRFCDRAQLTLLVGHFLADRLPDRVLARIRANRESNALRVSRLHAALEEIIAAFDAQDIEYVLLKGSSHDAHYGSAPELRPQYDLDFFAPTSSLDGARSALLSLRYEALKEMSRFPTDHLPAMVRKTGWQWRGDFFDPEIPPSVDLHFRWWDRETERFDAPGAADFWERRTRMEICGRVVTVLDETDRFGYAALHALRHLLRGSLRIYHIYELGHFLHVTAEDSICWDSWQRLHPAALRRLQAIPLLLAHSWFGGSVPAAVREEWGELPEPVRFWMERHAAGPLEALFHPDKSELWLHVSLLERRRDQLAVIRRRLLPLGPPGPVDSVYVPDAAMTLPLRARRSWKYTAHVCGRALHHLSALAPALVQGAAWSLARRRSAPFLAFLLGANLYNLGVFVFFLLYNLLLLDTGFDERFVGRATGAMTAGSIAAALPAAALARRLGLRRMLILAAAGMTVLLAARALLVSPAAVLVTATGAGVISSLWFVSLPPAVAQLRADGRRAFGLSIWLATGIATGVAGGFLGGRLPSWFVAAGIASGPASAKRMAILAACIPIALASWPLSRLRLSAPPLEARVYPRSPFIARFLLAVAVWQLAIGAFNPFFNVYFARRLSMPLEQIGTVFAASQLIQAGAVLLAPFLLRRTGMTSGVAALQLAAAASLALLGTAVSPWGAAAVYMAYMSVQAMTEPGLFHIMLDRVRVPEQGGASALMFLVMFACQAVAALVAGSAVLSLGYERLLGGAAVLAALAALLCRGILSDRPAATERISNAAAGD